MARGRGRRAAGRSAGASLVEVMAAMCVLLVGAAGVASIHTQGLRVHGAARRMTRATAIAQDLLAAMESWTYDDQSASGGPLHNTSAANDADLGDAAQALEASADPVGAGLVDHGEADLPATFAGIRTAELGDEYQRFWTVALPPNASGGVDAMRIAVVVRWPAGAGWRRVILFGAKPNPATVH